MKLPEDTRKRLVLENCEKNFNIEDCLEISKRVGVPVVLDNHHYYCYNQIHPESSPKYDISTYIPMVLDTWSKKGFTLNFILVSKDVEKQVTIVILSVSFQIII